MRAEVGAGRPVDNIYDADVTHLEAAGPRIFVYRLIQARPAAVNGEPHTQVRRRGASSL